MRMRYEIKVINVGGFTIDDLEPDRQISGYTVYYCLQSYKAWHDTPIPQALDCI